MVYLSFGVACIGLFGYDCDCYSSFQMFLIPCCNAVWHGVRGVSAATRLGIFTSVHTCNHLLWITAVMLHGLYKSWIQNTIEQLLPYLNLCIVI